MIFWVIWLITEWWWERTDRKHCSRIHKMKEGLIQWRKDYRQGMMTTESNLNRKITTSCATQFHAKWLKSKLWGEDVGSLLQDLMKCVKLFHFSFTHCISRFFFLLAYLCFTCCDLCSVDMLASNFLFKKVLTIWKENCLHAMYSVISKLKTSCCQVWATCRIWKRGLFGVEFHALFYICG